MKINENGITREMTEEEILAMQPSQEEQDRMELEGLYQFLKDTDYVVLKLYEGVCEEGEYDNILVQRQEARLRINELSK